MIQSINFSLRRGELVGVVGKIGSGKSSFLLSIISEIPKYSGTYQLQAGTRIAYVEQEPYIFSGTVRENILFGKAFEERLYGEVVRVCQLQPDLDLMNEGDLTEIGERGVNLSGGQKTRIVLARALYSQSDLYLLDDPLSAVDAKVAHRIFYDAIKGFLKERAVILVTHQIHYARKCDRICIFEGGSIASEGGYQNVVSQLSAHHIPGVEEEEEQQQQYNKQLKETEQSSHKLQLGSERSEPRDLAPRTSEKGGQEQPGEDARPLEKPQAVPRKLIQGEEKEQIKVTLGTYRRYLLYARIPCIFAYLVVLFAGNEVLFTFFF